jgi:hypothetical protein
LPIIVIGLGDTFRLTVVHTELEMLVIQCTVSSSLGRAEREIKNT